MRYYSIFIILLVSTISSTYAGTNIYFDNINYRIELVGKKYFVYQPLVMTTIQDISGLSKIDCDLLSEQITKKEVQYYICNEMPDSPTCRLLKKDVVFKSKEENFQTPAILHSAERTWILKPKNQAIDEDALKNHIAVTLGVPKYDVIVRHSTEIPAPEFPVIKISESSLLNRVTKILPMAPGFLEPLRIVNGNLVVNNRFLACDIESGALNIMTKSTANLSYTDAAYDDLRSLTSTETLNSCQA